MRASELMEIIKTVPEDQRIRIVIEDGRVGEHFIEMRRDVRGVMEIVFDRRTE